MLKNVQLKDSDTGTAIAFVAEGSPVRFLLCSYVKEQPLLMTRTAIGDRLDIITLTNGHSHAPEFT